MRSNLWVKLVVVALLALCLLSETASAQTEDQKLVATILHDDSLFWAAYNNCDIEKFRGFFTEDVEMYHDKGGLTVGVETLVRNMAKNLCGGNSFRLRREAVEGSVRVFPLKNGDGIYGAIISGEHLFYVLEKGKKERLDGLAKFTHVWVLRENTWKMSRVLSYDHGPAPYINKRQEITLPSTRLDLFVGKYVGPQTGVIKIERAGNELVLSIHEGQKSVLYAETENRFFIKERDLTFEFVKDSRGEVSRMLVRENGEIVEEAVYSK
jgi:hypothetical protein